MTWGPVRNAFVRKDKLYAMSASKDLHSSSLFLLSLATGIKPFSGEAENMAPPEAVAAKPIEKPVEKPAEKPEDKPVEKVAEPVAVEHQQVDVAPIEQIAEKIVEKPRREAC